MLNQSVRVVTAGAEIMTEKLEESTWTRLRVYSFVYLFSGSLVFSGYWKMVNRISVSLTPYYSRMCQE